MYFIRTSLVLNIIYKTMKPFIHEVTLAKFKFLGKNYKDELLKIMDED